MIRLLFSVLCTVAPDDRMRILAGHQVGKRVDLLIQLARGLLRPWQPRTAYYAGVYANNAQYGPRSVRTLPAPLTAQARGSCLFTDGERASNALRRNNV